MRKRALNCSLAVILALAVPAIAVQPGAISPQASCAATGTIVVSYETDAFKAEFFGNSPYAALGEDKTLVLIADDLVPGKSRICLKVWVLKSAEANISSEKPVKLRLKGTSVLNRFFDLTPWGRPESSAPGSAARPCVDDTELCVLDTGRSRRASFTYVPPQQVEWEDIDYPKGSQVWYVGKRITFSAQIQLIKKLDDSASWVLIDPDVVIIKPGG